MKAQNMTIEEALLLISKNILNKRKTKILFFTIFMIFSIIAIIFAPEWRAIFISNDPRSFLVLITMSSIVSVAGVSFLFTFLPVMFNFNAKPRELIAVIDKALEKYLTETKLTLYCCNNTFQALNERKNKSEKIKEMIVKTERDICRINEHLKVINEKTDEIKKKAILLASAS